MRALTVTAFSVLAGLAAAPAGQAATPCPAKPKAVVAKAPDAADGYAYRVGKVLYGCGRANADSPLRVFTLGPWTPQSKARIDRVDTVLWTERRATASGSEDRIWVSGLASRPWVRGIASARKPSDRRVAQLLAGSAWVTQGGAVAVARQQYDAGSVDVVGLGTAGASGLVKAPKPAGARLELGRWGADAVDALAGSFLIEDRGGDADGCAAVNAYAALVTPVAGQPPVGVSWTESSRYNEDVCGG